VPRTALLLLIAPVVALGQPAPRAPAARVQARESDTPPSADSASPARRGILPILGYADATGIQFGALVFRTFRAGGAADARPSSEVVYAAHTVRGHDKAHVQIERWSPDNGRYTRVRVEHISYPLPYYGIGPATPDSAGEWYSAGVTTLQLLVQRAFRPAWYVLGGYRLSHARLRETEPGGALRDRLAAGASDTRVGQLHLGLVRDSRDHTGVPFRGTYARLVLSLADHALGSGVSFRRLTLDARRYHALPRGGVLAGQIQYDALAGSAPFDHLPMIGADTAMRGYDRGRYRDRHAATAQLEVRTGHWHRLGLVAFAGAGAVAPGARALRDGPWYPSAGFGTRVVLTARDRGVARADLGFGRHGMTISVGLNEAF
jgi:hypothetical protein